MDLGKVQGGFSGVLGCFLKGLERGLEGSEEGKLKGLRCKLVKLQRCVKVDAEGIL